MAKFKICQQKKQTAKLKLFRLVLVVNARHNIALPTRLKAISCFIYFDQYFTFEELTPDWLTSSLISVRLGFLARYWPMPINPAGVYFSFLPPPFVFCW